jgi:hypothetical protein
MQDMGEGVDAGQDSEHMCKSLDCELPSVFRQTGAKQ